LRKKLAKAIKIGLMTWDSLSNAKIVLIFALCYRVLLLYRDIGFNVYRVAIILLVYNAQTDFCPTLCWNAGI
jgi:hypothetical protein